MTTGRPFPMKTFAFLMQSTAIMTLEVAGWHVPMTVRHEHGGIGVPAWPKSTAIHDSFRRHGSVPATFAMSRVSMNVETAPDPESRGAALTSTAVVISGATAFGACINQFMGADKALQFFAGYVVELSLSVDNLFVFLLLFRFFNVSRVGWFPGMCRTGGLSGCASL